MRQDCHFPLSRQSCQEIDRIGRVRVLVLGIMRFMYNGKRYLAQPMQVRRAMAGAPAGTIYLGWVRPAAARAIVFHVAGGLAQKGGWLRTARTRLRLTAGEGSSAGAHLA